MHLCVQIIYILEVLFPDPFNEKNTRLFTVSLFCNHGLRAIDFILDSQIVTQYSTLKTSKSLYFENKNNNYKVLFIYPFIASLLRPSNPYIFRDSLHFRYLYILNKLIDISSELTVIDPAFDSPMNTSTYDLAIGELNSTNTQLPFNPGHLLIFCSTSYIDFNNSSEKARVDKSKLFFALNSISTLRHLNSYFHYTSNVYWLLGNSATLSTYPKSVQGRTYLLDNFPVSIPDTSCLNKPSLRDSPRLVYIMEVRSA